VDTSKPTEFPFVITYNVKDSGKPQLAAREVRRRVFVLNPCAGKAADGGDEILCEDSGKCSTNGACIELAEEVVVVVNLAPVVTLKGPATLDIAQYTGYVQCPPGDVPVSALCDRGATAKDDKDGDLTDFVLACEEKYTDNGIAGCYVDTNKVGRFRPQVDMGVMIRGRGRMPGACLVPPYTCGSISLSLRAGRKPGASLT
jgi:hypothetical protein